jgi:hypothetical protein
VITVTLVYREAGSKREAERLIIISVNVVYLLLCCSNTRGRAGESVESLERESKRENESQSKSERDKAGGSAS